jgi:AGCS family alanine or glycine:cation symporter
MGDRWKWLASLYCFFGVIAAFGVGNATQINTVIGGIVQIGTYFSIEISMRWRFMIGVILAVLIGRMLLGGAKKIGKVAEKMVPFASFAYIVLCFGVLVVCRKNIIPAVCSIITGAFTPRAVTGGALGSAFTALRVGASRGVFTNEAGMGTAGIAHAAAKVEHPVQQGFMGMIEVFLDTIVICTLTAIVILCSPVSVVYGEDVGVELTISAFSGVYGGWVSILLSCLLICFAVATVLGWGVYGARCAQYLFGEGVWKRFVYIQMIVVVAGALLGAGTVWILADIVNGLMAIPNLIALSVLGKQVFQLIRDYKAHPIEASGAQRDYLIDSVEI